MGLNCKVGELAFINARSNYPENVNAIVRIVRAYVRGEVLPGHRYGYNTSSGEHAWVVESMGRLLVAAGEPLVRFSAARDLALTPIRPGDLTQEDVDALYKPEVIKQRDPEAA